MKRFQAVGFTLIELLLALTLLGALMLMIWAALSIGVRAWDSGEALVGEAAQQRVVQTYLRRELAQVFPARWRGIPESRITFEGSRQELRFVTALNLDAGLKDGGLQWARLTLRDDGKNKALWLTREAFDLTAKDWSTLDSAPSTSETRLLDNLSDLEIAYFGSDNDTNEPGWLSDWNFPLRVPQLIRLTFKTTNGRAIPDLVVRLQIGEEAGCYQNNFQRQCGPRPA